MTRPLVLFAVALCLGACGSVRPGRDDARDFTADALRAAGLTTVGVATAVTRCEVAGARGWRTTAATEVGEVSLCVSRDASRALSVRDPGLSDAQFDRLDRYRGKTPEDRARPLASASAALLLLGAAIQLLLHLRPPRGRPS